MAYLFDPAPVIALPIVGDDRSFPVRRVFCVGRNYEAHAAELGNKIDRDDPFYFTKSPLHIVVGDGEAALAVGTDDYHHEIEFVVALSDDLNNATPEQAMEAVFGYGVGQDMTRRDLQNKAKDKRRPWDTAKDVEQSAILSAITPKAAFGDIGDQMITLTVNGKLQQEGKLSDMVWSVPEILSHLSTLYTLRAGDIIMTGTPSGVGPVAKGDVLVSRVDGCEPLTTTIV